jgi:hypothetical protein
LVYDTFDNKLDVYYMTSNYRTNNGPGPFTTAIVGYHFSAFNSGLKIIGWPKLFESSGDVLYSGHTYNTVEGDSTVYGFIAITNR